MFLRAFGVTRRELAAEGDQAVCRKLSEGLAESTQFDTALAGRGPAFFLTLCGPVRSWYALSRFGRSLRAQLAERNWEDVMAGGERRSPAAGAD